jgi:hypothetical protein
MTYLWLPKLRPELSAPIEEVIHNETNAPHAKKIPLFVAPVKTVVQKPLNSLDTGIRRHDGTGNLKWFWKRLLLLNH